MVLRSVRTHGGGPFTPHVALSVGLLLAFACVGTLVLFIGHNAWRINVDTVVDLVSNEVAAAVRRLALKELEPDITEPTAPLPVLWWSAAAVTSSILMRMRWRAGPMPMACS